jgi:hypothetical protein
VSANHLADRGYFDSEEILACEPIDRRIGIDPSVAETLREALAEAGFVDDADGMEGWLREADPSQERLAMRQRG